MQLLSARDVPRWDVIRTFRYRPWGALIILVITLGFVIVPAGLVMRGILPLPLDSLPWWAWVAVTPFLLIALLFWLLIAGALWRAALACFRPDNWIMKLTRSGLYLQYRSYLNHHFPHDGPTAVYVPYADIEVARKTTKRTESIDSRGRTRVMRTGYLDLKLRHTETDALRDAITRESTRRPPQKGCSSFRFNHVPVRVTGRGVIRVEWRGRAMLTALRDRVSIGEPQRTDDETGPDPNPSQQIVARL